MNRKLINELRRLYKELMRLESQLERLKMSDSVYKKEMSEIDDRFNRYSQLEERKKKLELDLNKINEEIINRSKIRTPGKKNKKRSKFQRFLKLNVLKNTNKSSSEDEKQKLKSEKHLIEEELKEIERELFAASQYKANSKKRRKELQGHIEHNDTEMNRLRSKKPSLQSRLIDCLEACYEMEYQSPEDLAFLERVLSKVMSFTSAPKSLIFKRSTD